MKKGWMLLLLLSWLTPYAQYATYSKTTAMIPMRDGVKLFTSIYSPVNIAEPLPILLRRTPYGALTMDTVNMAAQPYYHELATSGYIFVFQDIRGKFKSEGQMEMSKPMYHKKDPGAVDESTDCYDTVDWLVKNVAHNNGKAGINGISYPGWLALMASVDPHPALKAASEQATPADMFLGDDFHHNGAFRLSYGFEYAYLFEHDKNKNSDFPFPQYDLYDWYLQLGPLGNVNARYFHNALPAWNNFSLHPNYDSFWYNQSAFQQVTYPEIPMLHVGGYYDQEDLNGPQSMYELMEQKDSAHKNYIILGPWNHGGWAGAKGDSLGKISFHSPTANWFQQHENKWFGYWLKGVGDGKFEEAWCFQTGADQWKSYSSWPPKESVSRKLYAGPEGRCSFQKTIASTGYASYISDPAHPVPYRIQPIEATYGNGSRWYPWQVEDQRFVYSRPDVVSFTLDSLTEDLTVSGKVTAHLFASTSGTDADWVVKLIDVYPAFEPNNEGMSQYQFPVTMEVFRGRFRKSFEKPQPLVPNKPEEFVIGLHQVNHTFKKGHRIMIQIQSTWFPLIDRNPQTFVPNIFEAKKADYVKAEHRIYFSGNNATYIELPVAR